MDDQAAAEQRREDFVSFAETARSIRPLSLIDLFIIEP